MWSLLSFLFFRISDKFSFLADGDLYSGTVADFQGTIPLIFRQPLKTDHNDYNQLNGKVGFPVLWACNGLNLVVEYYVCD